MGEKTAISWTDHTFNPWMGCTKVSPACAHCYAERDMDHRYGKVKWGPNGTRRMTADWSKPLSWNRKAEKAGVRARVFCASLADVFEDWQGPIINHRVDTDGTPFQLYHFEGWYREHRLTANICLDPVTMGDLRADLFKLIDATPWLDWLLLTKRPESIRAMWPRCTRCRGNGRIEMLEHCPACKGKGMSPLRPNVWLGTTVENQEYADQRIPELLKCRDLSPVLFLSCEPLLGEVDLRNIQRKDEWKVDSLDGIYSRHHEEGVDHPAALEEHGGGPHLDWVIAGGESGPNARPSHPDWFRSLRDQCQTAGVPFHFKQWGEWAENGDGVGRRGDPWGCIAPDGQWFPYPSSNDQVRPTKDGACMIRVGKKSAGRALDGHEWNELPQVEAPV